MNLHFLKKSKKYKSLKMNIFDIVKEQQMKIKRKIQKVI